MNLVTLDFETYYCSKTYSLSMMTTEEYVRDPRFQVIGVGIKIGDGPTRWYTGADAAAALASIDWSRTLAVAHNAMFDGAVLGWHYGRKPARWFCTLAAARGLFGLDSSVSLASVAERLELGKKGSDVVNADGLRLEHFTPAHLAQYGAYCVNDVELCHAIAKRLWPEYPATERNMIAWTTEQFSAPLLEIDVPLLRTALTRLETDLQRARDSVGMTQTALRSDPAFAEALIACGVPPPTKTSPTTGDEAWAFSKQDVEFMDLLEHDDPRVVALVEARLGNKTSLAESRMNRLIAIGERGPLPVPLAYAGAMTTKRWIGTDKINMQNFPRGGTIRAAIRAPKGYYMVAGDLSQIELRVNAWQSGQQELLDELTRPDGDPYSAMATEVYGFEVKKSTHPLERFVGKVATLSCAYGCGAAKFRTMLRVAARRDHIVLADESADFAASVVRAYREKNTRIRAFWGAAQAAIVRLATGERGSLGPYLIDRGRLHLPNGQYLYYPKLRREGDDWVYTKRHQRRRASITTRLYGPKLVENITQAVARLPMCDAIERLWVDYGQWCRPVLTVHDEVVTLWRNDVPRDEAKGIVMHALTNIKNATLRDFFSTLPLAAEVKSGDTYGDVK